MNDGFTRLLERDQLHQLLVDVYPALADRIEVDDANPMLTIPPDTEARSSCGRARAVESSGGAWPARMGNG